MRHQSLHSKWPTILRQIAHCNTIILPERWHNLFWVSLSMRPQVWTVYLLMVGLNQNIIIIVVAIFYRFFVVLIIFDQNVVVERAHSCENSVSQEKTVLF